MSNRIINAIDIAGYVELSKDFKEKIIKILKILKQLLNFIEDLIFQDFGFIISGKMRKFTRVTSRIFLDLSLMIKIRR